jgi:hypothetical protein
MTPVASRSPLRSPPAWWPLDSRPTSSWKKVVGAHRSSRIETDSDARLGDGVPLFAIAAQMGCHESTLRRAVRDHTATSRSPWRRYPQVGDRDWLTARFIRRRDPVDQTAAELGCSPGAVLLAVAWEGLPASATPTSSTLCATRRRERGWGHLHRDPAGAHERHRRRRQLRCRCGFAGAIHAHGLRRRRRHSIPLLQDRDWLETQCRHRTAGDISRRESSAVLEDPSLPRSPPRGIRKQAPSSAWSRATQRLTSHHP